jgi:VCBS repeat-containing protein
MAALIGVVSKVIGQVFAVASNGERRAVVEGDRLYAGETLDTGAAGAVAVHLTSGNELTLGRGSSLLLSTQLLSDQPPSIVVHDQTPVGGTQLTEVQQIQEAIAAGADPTQTLEATAAGPGGATVYTNTPAGDLGGGHSFVLLTETAGAVAPTVGFPTVGLDFPILDPDRPISDLLVADADGITPGVPPVITPPVTVPPVDVPTPPVDQPTPPVDQPIPPVDQPIPPVDQPNPPVDQPEPPTAPNNGITFVDLYDNGGEQRVNEADLPNGTSTAQGTAGDLARNDTFSVIAPDGLASLTIDGVQVVLNGQLVSDTVQIIGQLGNTLTITGYNADTGVFNYTYVLSVAGDNNQGASNLELSEDFHLVANDTDGDNGDAWLNVRITDDSPIANPDTADQTATERATQLTGSVLSNDYVGADVNATPVTPAVLVGTYGTLTLAADGTYTYVLNTQGEAFQALLGGESGIPEVFTYTLTDGDGDSATSTLTINVGNVDDPVTFGGLKSSGGDLIFSEGDLPNGSSTQPDKADWLTDHSSFTVDAKDGLDSLTIAGVQVVEGGQLVSPTVEVVGQWGNVLTITNYNAATGEFKYTYVLSQPGDNNAPGSGDTLAETQLSDDFLMVATDRDGDSSQAWINITVTDDAPVTTAQTQTATVGVTGTNVLLVIDVSNSMNDIVRGTDQTRLDLAKQAIDSMLAQYADAGDVRVQVTTFNNQSHDLSTSWVDVATAIDLVNGLTAGGGTNYDYALTGAQTAFDAAGKLTAAGTQTVSYFVSDGNPTLSSTHDRVTDEQSGNDTNPELGDGIDATEEAAWVQFLTDNGIKSYAIGIGNAPSAQYLDPIAYDASSTPGTNTGAILVRDITELPDVLGGTVVGAGVSGNLTDGGSFGADGGYVQSLSVDGVRYTFDGQDTLQAGDGADSSAYRFDASTHQLMISTAEGGALMVNMDTGAYTYAPPAAASTAFTETVLFTLTDNDGDTSSNTLSVNVLVEAPVTATAQTVITNVADSSDTAAAAAILATAASTDAANAITYSSTTTARGADFTATAATPVDFDGHSSSRVNRYLEIERSQFTNNAALMTAALVVTGYLGAAGSASANDEDTFSVSLKKGETLHLDSTLGSQASIAWAADGDSFTTLQQDNFTASEDGVYTIRVTEHGATAESYSLNMVVDYSQAASTLATTDTAATATDSDASGSAAVHYQAGHDLVGTTGDDVIVAGDGENRLQGGDGNDVLVAGDGGSELHGDAGDDLLVGGAGNDLLDGSAGNNTASYQNATAGVHVDLGLAGQAQDTQGAGQDTLFNIQNLIGSAHDDVLIGDSHDNVITGGQGNDVMTGGGGSDTFKWLAADTGSHDTVTDFKLGNDTLDLSQLLQGENSVASSLENFLQFKVTGSGDSLVSTIEISQPGQDAASQSISLNQVDVAGNYGVQVGAGGMVASGHDTATIISGMLSDHSLKADTV